MAKTTRTQAIIKKIDGRFKQYRDEYENFITLGNLIRLYIQGEQIELIDHNGNPVQVLGLTDEDNPYLAVMVNQFRVLAGQVISKLQEHLVRFQVAPITSDKDDEMVAKACEALLNGIAVSNRFQSKINEAVHWLVSHGEFYLYPHMVNKGSRTDEPDFGSAYEIELGVLHPSRVFCDPEDETSTKRNARWAFIKHRVSKEDLMAVYPKARETIEAIESDEKNLLSYYEEYPNDDSIVIYDYYERASRAHPEGRHLVLLPYAAVDKRSNQLYGREEEYPWTILFEGKGYKHGQIPVIRVVMDYTGGPFGGTPFKDMLSIQAIINYMFGKIAATVDYYGDPKLLVDISSTDPESLTNDPGGIIYMKKVLGDYNRPTYLTPPPVPGDLYNLINSFISFMRELAGSSPWDRGEFPKIDNATGYTIADTYYQRQMKPRLKNMAEAYSRMGEQVLALVAEFYGDKEETLMAYMGRQGKDLIPYISGAEGLKNIKRNSRNIVVDVGQEGVYSKSVRLNLAQELVRNGLIPMNSPAIQAAVGLFFAREVGLNIEGYNEAVEKQRQQAIMENEAIRDGKHVEVMRSDNHPVHIEIHQAEIAGIPVEERGSDYAQNLDAHIQVHKEMARMESVEEATKAILTQAQLALIQGKAQQKVQAALGAGSGSTQAPPGAVADGSQGGRPPEQLKRQMVAAEQPDNTNAQ